MARIDPAIILGPLARPQRDWIAAPLTHPRLAPPLRAPAGTTTLHLHAPLDCRALELKTELTTPAIMEAAARRYLLGE
ncbi:MAG: hypothetical protein HY696_13135 [Deltaproteobacteria bacterium]|nr:hypothetical protein [Deltaproteobacteria bacterium]